MPPGIERQRPNHDPAVGVATGAGATPEHDPEPRVELLEPERLGHEVVRAAVQRLDLLPLGEPCRQDHDRGHRVAPDPPDHVQAVHVGQAEVEQHDVGPARLPALERRAPVGRVLDAIAARAELAHQHRPDLVVVLDDQDGRARAGHRAVASSAGKRA